MRRTMRALPLVGAAAWLLAAAPAHAQLPADARWLERTSTHFRITYEPALDELARHTVAAAERAWGALEPLVGRPPRGRVDIILADNLDLSNGFATPFPSNRIVLYAKPPVDVLELQYTRDWIELVVTHELAHIFQLDATSAVGRALRTVFGRVPGPWPFFPAVGTPAWSIEGLAVGVESAVTGLGRVHGSYHDMIVRTAALAGSLDEYDRLGSSSARWPGAARTYVYGSLFMHHLATRYGADAAARIVTATAGAVIPPPLWFDRAGKNALGTTFRSAYREWLDLERARADSVERAARAHGVTEGERLTTHGAIALHPRFSPDGAAIAYASYDWRAPPAVRAIRTHDGREIWGRRTNSPAPVSWIDERSVITADVEFTDAFRIFSDLELAGAVTTRLTRGTRLQEPDAAQSGRIVAVQNEAGTNRLVLVDMATGGIRPLTDYAPDVHWLLPRWSPDGTRIAATRYRAGGRFDIVVLDTLGGAHVALTDDDAVNTGAAWTPDGGWILFGSDRSGIPDIYAVAADARKDGTPLLRQVTSVLTGAFHPDVSPDGRWIVYAAYADDGFHIERIPLDTTTWRTPAPSAARPRTAMSTDPAHAAMRTAVAAADTTLGEPRGYPALRSLRPRYWVPVPTTGDDDRFYIGAATAGRDLVARHLWAAHLAFAPSNGRSRGSVSYSFHGISAIAGLQPSIAAGITRDWETVLPQNAPDAPRIDEREDAAAVSLSLLRQRWRSVSGLSVAGERVQRSRKLYDAPGLQLLDPRDDLAGVRASAYYSRFVQPPRSISRESGFTVQATVRDRRDRDVRTVTRDDGSTVTLDGSYRELTSWNAMYITLPLPGFARHVLALRMSGLAREGPGAGFSSIGGVSSTGTVVTGADVSFGASAMLLPLRGYRRGERAGTHAYTASAEYRFPVAHIDAPLRPLFVDRLSGAIFADAGHAWCGAGNAARLPTGACASTSIDDAPLVAAGAEATLLVAAFGIAAPLRIGAAIPLERAARNAPRAYFVVGHSF